MRLVTYHAGKGPRAGALVSNCIVDLNAASGARLPSDMLGLLAQEGGIDLARRIVADSKRDWSRPDGNAVFGLSQARLMAPVGRPGKVICLGLNYRDHARESKMPAPSEPVIFSKASSSVIGPGEPIVLPEASREVDYEVELAFVIGRRAKLVRAAEAMGCVAGYTVLNDVSARDYQHGKPGKQWFLAKSFDTFCPTGPWIVTADEVPDPHDLKLSCEVSGQTLQASSTAQMLFRIPVIIEYLARVFTLEPGDVVATGTPSGVGFARVPPRFLQKGDVVRCTVEGIGTLENPVV